jgi:AbrB family looped-hinge helix DNA binding protein
MNAIRSKLGNNGRIIIPSSFRQNLHLNKGDDIILHVEENVIFITTPAQSLRKLQEKFKNCVDASPDKQGSLVDELLAQRRAEAER